VHCCSNRAVERGCKNPRFLVSLEKP